MSVMPQDAGSFHLAGIVPCHGLQTDFGVPWDDVMMPVAADFLAIERSILECAYAGCETIWVVVSPYMLPILKERIGEWIGDPLLSTNKHINNKFYDYKERRRPIYYITINPQDRKRRDSLMWSVNWGAYTARRVGHMMSHFIMPDRNYVSFPYGVYNPQIVKKHRHLISNNKHNFYLEYDNKTAFDGLYLGFTFTEQERKVWEEFMRLQGTGLYNKSGSKLTDDEKYSARFFKLEDVLDPATIDDEAPRIEVEHYNSIDCWDKYCDYLGSQHRLVLNEDWITALERSKIKKLGR